MVDEHGAKLTSGHAVKNGKRYRCYLAARHGAANGSAWRLPAHDIEVLVTREVVEFLCDRRRLTQALEPWRLAPDQLQGVFHAAEILSEQLNGSGAQRRAALVGIAKTIEAGVSSAS